MRSWIATATARRTRMMSARTRRFTKAMCAFLVPSPCAALTPEQHRTLADALRAVAALGSARGRALALLQEAHEDPLAVLAARIGVAELVVALAAEPDAPR